ncbi:hypothetical protein A3A75_03515 [Candidatus Woesebacteria bacterium RIFCSPLOWO2_01_FULL_39_10]|uniref:Glycosyl transferase family 1 domain-containing protein n=1 Tax=Candidatus Woesebacteria bacterium RIFCSPLOWO2_01_FULL_39_10 TaxID=1802516 RepID=A0A1F8B942_9BACT|nr:MAG: hypothetical protein A3A75_03515 [Candidatus Woesebacteria bacterium RIFCSPLOWO2_01_FULL_39_10]
MNILILSWRGPGHPNAGGAEQVTFEHAKGWIKGGHDVTLFTSFFDGAKKEGVIDGVKIKRAGRQFFEVQFKAFLWYFFGKHQRFDLVVDEIHGIPFFTPIYVRSRKLAFIHEVAKEVWKLNPWPKPFNLIPSILGTLLEPWVFRLFYTKVPFMTVSNSTKNDLISWGIPKSNVTVIHNGVKLFLPNKLPVKEVKNTAMYLGAISEDKGTLDAIKAFAEIERKDDTWQYWIVGPGSEEYLGKLKKLVRELGIEMKLKVWGFVSEKKKFELLARAHILINPSVHEGWSLVNIEANSVGTPVIGYNVHGLRDSVINAKTGILVNKGVYRSLAETAVKLVRNKGTYEKFQKNCKKWATKFTWEKAVKESLGLVESL